MMWFRKHQVSKSFIDSGSGRGGIVKILRRIFFVSLTLSKKIVVEQFNVSLLLGIENFCG